MALREEIESQGNWLFRYRSYLPLIIVGIGLWLYLKTELNPDHYFFQQSSLEYPYEMFAVLVSLIGFAIRVYTVGYTPMNTSGRNTAAGQVADSLNTLGAYSLVRHPLYVGNFLMWLGLALWTANFWFIIAFCLLYWVYYERIMYAEEEFLRRKFGETYVTWAAGVPAFIPKLSGFQKPEATFNWRKIFEKEKNGIFALFLLFTTFNVLGEYITGRNDYNYFLIAMCILTGLSYIVLKYMKMRRAAQA